MQRVFALCDRWSSVPSVVLGESAELLQWLEIERLGGEQR